MPQIQKAKAGAGHDLWLVYAAHGKDLGDLIMEEITDD
jgi:hypothetical protein